MTDDRPQLLTEQMLTAASGVLGSMIIDADCIGPVLAQVDATDFQLPEHRAIYQAIKGLYAQGRPVDAILVREVLGDKYTEILAKLIEITPTSANADAYAQALRKSAQLWQLQDLGQQLSSVEDADAARDLVDKASRLLVERAGIQSVDLKRGLLDFVDRQSQKGQNRGLPWCFPKLQGVLHVEDGDMVVLGGYPSAGKTALALQMAYDMAQKGRSVGFYSYETDYARLMERILATQTGTSFRKMQEPGLDAEDVRKIWEQRSWLLKPDMMLINAYGMGVGDIGAYAMAHHHDVIVIDYLQKLPGRSTGSKWMDDFARVSQVSNDLQQLGRSTGKTILALSQLSRPEKSKGGEEKAPTMASLRQSGQIEQDADVVLLLYKDRAEYSCTTRTLAIAKNKNGEAGWNLSLNFDGDHQRFTQVDHRHQDGEPAPAGPTYSQLAFGPVDEGGESPFEKYRRSKNVEEK